MGDEKVVRCVDVTHIGREIRARRKQLGYTQEEVAPVVGMSPRLVGEIERGRDTVGIGKVLRLCQVLGLDIELRERS